MPDSEQDIRPRFHKSKTHSQQHDQDGAIDVRIYDYMDNGNYCVKKSLSMAVSGQVLALDFDDRKESNSPSVYKLLSAGTSFSILGCAR